MIMHVILRHYVQYINVMKSILKFILPTRISMKCMGVFMKVWNQKLMVAICNALPSKCLKLEKEGTKARIEIKGREEIP